MKFTRTNTLAFLCHRKSGHRVFTAMQVCVRVCLCFGCTICRKYAQKANDSCHLVNQKSIHNNWLVRFRFDGSYGDATRSPHTQLLCNANQTQFNMSLVSLVGRLSSLSTLGSRSVSLSVGKRQCHCCDCRIQNKISAIECATMCQYSDFTTPVRIIKKRTMDPPESEWNGSTQTNTH